MSFQPRDRRRSSTSMTAAATSRPTTIDVDDELFRELKLRLRSEGHVTNVATKELLMRNFLADAHKKQAARELSDEQEDRKNDTCVDRESGGGIVSLLSNAFSLGSEVHPFQDQQSATTGNKLFGGARRPSTTSTTSTVTSYSQSASSSTGLYYAHGQPHHVDLTAVSPKDCSSRQGMVHQCRRLSEQFSTSIGNMTSVDGTRRSSMPSNTAAYFPNSPTASNTCIQRGDEVHVHVERRRSSLLSMFGGHRSLSMGSSQSIHRLSSMGSAYSVSIDSSGLLHTSMSSLHDVDEVSREGDSTTSSEDNIPTAALTREDVDSTSPLNNANREFKISLSAANYPLICGWSSDEGDDRSLCGSTGDTSSCDDDEASKKKNGDPEKGAPERVLKFTAHGSRAA
mmetsp:Transcript_5388/g.15253  ORF Transcript_5388/g.15253 Transcript_5388/m.15253 type:complete len:398 (-) Transcript_5388:56-1249(-)